LKQECVVHPCLSPVHANVVSCIFLTGETSVLRVILNYKTIGKLSNLYM
jgi:hypothetical protein